jgi:sec-independent protein translocase protein TatA
MGDIGVPELLIILAIAIAVFGAGRLAGAGKAMGTSIKEFKRAIRDDDPPATNTPEIVERRETESRTV